MLKDDGWCWRSLKDLEDFMGLYAMRRYGKSALTFHLEYGIYSVTVQNETITVFAEILYRYQNNMANEGLCCYSICQPLRSSVVVASSFSPSFTKPKHVDNPTHFVPLGGT